MARQSGISRLMDDLASALGRRRDMVMMGGGNPAHIGEVQKHFRASAERLLAGDGEFEKAVGDYGPSGGNANFIEAVAKLLCDECGWEIGPENIALTNGSQVAFFVLFNIFAGPCDDGADRKILLPLTPEYIGYSDVGMTGNIFAANRPQIKHLDEHIFKYQVDFDELDVGEETGAICVSRPTNPTGNVLTDCEIAKLRAIARKNGVPLIIDNAYGTPFPNIIFTEAKPVWDDNTIVCMSLSKLGLPGTRTGIVVASREVIKIVCEVNAVVSLSPGSMGAAIATDMVRTGEILEVSRGVIRPFYESKAKFAVELLSEELDGVDYHIHKPEGAMFLWLWLRDLPITCMELYERLKEAGVLVVPGNYFFPGLEGEWRHKDECIRINHSGEEEAVTKGIKIIAQEVKRAYEK